MNSIEFSQRKPGNEERQKKPLDFQVLLHAWEQMQDVHDSYIYNSSNQEEKEQYSAVIRKEEENFLQKLIAEKENFLRVFETDRGSVYFQMKDASVVRFKKTEFGYSIQRPANPLFFLESNIAEEFIQYRQARSEMINREFRTTNYQNGVYPVEFYLDDNEYYEIELTPDGFKILSKKDIPSHIEPALPNHVGHKVSKVYK